MSDFDEDEPHRKALVITDPTPCKDDPDLFFPKGNDPRAYELPKQLCNACPHRARCAQWALEQNEQHGVWGGLSPIDRRHLTREKSA